MAELKTKKTNASVKDFIDSQPDERVRKDCRALVRMMKAATGHAPTMWGTSIIGFGDYQYKSSRGTAFEWFPVGFSPRKRDLTLYLMAGLDPYAPLLGKLGKHTRGVGCLYIKSLSEVDQGVLETLIAQSL